MKIKYQILITYLQIMTHKYKPISNLKTINHNNNNSKGEGVD